MPLRDQVVLTEVPLSNLYAYNFRGLSDAIADFRKNIYNRKFRLEELYPIAGVYFAMDKGEALFADPNRGQIFYCKDGWVELVAGAYNVIGHKDGRGPDARFALGGLQGFYQVARNALGEWFIPEAKFNAIRKLVRREDETWDCSTWLTGVNVSGLAAHANGDLFATDGWSSVVQQIRPDKSIKSYQGPIPGMLHVHVRGDRVVTVTRLNAWDVTMRLDITTGQFIRLCGMTQQEISAYCAANGISEIDFFNANHDGPGAEAAFHSADPCYINEDARVIHYTGGDQPYVRRYNEATDLVETFMVDGSWRVQGVRIGGPHDNTRPNLPFFCFGSGGAKPDGRPQYSWPASWVPEGWRTRCVAEIGIIQVEDNPGGGNPVAHNSKLISFTYPPSVQAGQKFQAVAVLENTGTAPSTWTKANFYRLGTDQPHDDQTKFGVSRAELDADNIAPGQQVTITMNLTAPAKGNYTQTYQMVHDRNDASGPAAWFGAKATMTIVVTDVVQPPPPEDKAPVVDAGADQTVQQSLATLSGSAIDPEGKPLTGKWTQVSGPGPAAIAAPDKLTTDVALPAVGSYVFRLEASDGVNKSIDDVVITLLAPVPEPLPAPTIEGVKLTFPANFFAPPAALKMAVTFTDGSSQEIVARVEIEHE